VIRALLVHVGVPSRDLGVQVLARLRPWLAPLLAVAASSPIAGGHDTGWASWRYAIHAAAGLNQITAEALRRVVRLAVGRAGML
jgi:gamma-glutamyl:cysteine ligase YbdK (ATP-grasp superfamily)